MRQLALSLLVISACACGSPNLSKTPGGPGGPNNTSTNGTATNAATNSTSTNNTGPNTTTGPVNTSNGSTGVACDILTSDGSETYCNLQATCNDQPLLVECEFADSWYCYCGDHELTYDENPCGSPDTFAPMLAADCGTTTTVGPMNGCASTAFEVDYECSYGMACADDVEYAVACNTGDGLSICTCFVDGEAVEEFTAEGNTCQVGNDDLGWWNDGCGWALSF